MPILTQTTTTTTLADGSISPETKKETESAARRRRELLSELARLESRRNQVLAALEELEEDAAQKSFAEDEEDGKSAGAGKDMKAGSSRADANRRANKAHAPVSGSSTAVPASSPSASPSAPPHAIGEAIRRSIGRAMQSIQTDSLRPEQEAKPAARKERMEKGMQAALGEVRESCPLSNAADEKKVPSKEKTLARAEGARVQTTKEEGSTRGKTDGGDPFASLKSALKDFDAL